MSLVWSHAGPTVLAAFLASLVEFVEALTVVLAVGTVRGWRGALSGSGVAVLVLLALIAVLGTALTRIPLDAIQLVVGALLLLFGLRWLRKAILRAAGVIPLHDETVAFAKQTDAMRKLGGGGGWDRAGFAAAFQITMLEGTEVVFIVIATGAGGSGLLWPASLGALAALLVVVVLGVALASPAGRCAREHAEIRRGRVAVRFWLLLDRRGDGRCVAGRGLGDVDPQRRVSGRGIAGGEAVPCPCGPASFPDAWLGGRDALAEDHIVRDFRPVRG